MINSPDTVYNIFQLVQTRRRTLDIVPTISAAEVPNSWKHILLGRLDHRKAFEVLKIRIRFLTRSMIVFTFKDICFTFFVMFYGIVIILFPFEFFRVLIMCCS